MTEERGPHDPSLDAAWRTHVQDAPPRTLDDAILAAAHRAVQSGPRAAGAGTARWKAWAPLAVAATLGAIALGVLQLAPREEDATRAVIADSPVASPRQPAQLQRQETAATPAPPLAESATTPSSATAPAATAPAANAPSSAAASKPDVTRSRAEASDKLAKQAVEPPEEARAQRKAAQTTRAKQSTLERKDEVAGALAPQPFPAAPPPPAAAPGPPLPAGAAAAEPSPAARALESKTARPAAAVGAGAPLSAPAPAAPNLRNLGALDMQSAGRAAARDRDAGADARARVETATRTPDDFVREIHRLRADGRDADAALALAAFRAAYLDADDRLPEDLRAWARGVPRP